MCVVQSQVKKWGNSAAIRLPGAIMEAAFLVIDQDVDVRVEAGRVVIEPVRTPAYTLDDLLARMDPATFPDAVETGPPQGNEVW